MWVLLGQTTQGVNGSSDTVPISFDLLHIGSVTVVVVIAPILVNLLHRSITCDSFLAKVPAFVPIVVTSLALTLFAHYVTHTLIGDTRQLVYDTLLQSLASSGFYTWFIQGKALTPMSQTSASRQAQEERVAVKEWQRKLEEPITGHANEVVAKSTAASQIISDVNPPPAVSLPASPQLYASLELPAQAPDNEYENFHDKKPHPKVEIDTKSKPPLVKRDGPRVNSSGVKKTDTGIEIADIN